MFVTRPQFEQWIPEALGEEGDRYWKAVALSTEGPWFLVAARLEDDDCSFVRSYAIAWERTLIEVVQEVASESIVAVHCIWPSRSRSGEWSMKTISELWFPSDDEAERTGPLLLRVRGEDRLRDCHQQQVLGEDSRRQLLATYDC